MKEIKENKIIKFLRKAIEKERDDKLPYTIYNIINRVRILINF